MAGQANPDLEPANVERPDVEQADVGQVDSGTGDPRRRRQMRQAIIVLAIVAVVFAILFGWRSWLNMAPPPAAPPPTQVVATVVTATEISDALEAVGSLGAVREVMLASEVAGRVSAIRFTEGAYVGKGATLVQLNDGPERADRAAAVARAEFARQQLARARKLVISGAESREMVQQRQSEYDQARAAISQLDARLVQKRIAAPFSGRLGIRRVNPGQFLDAGDEVATLTDLNRLYVDFSVPQQDLSKLNIGGAVTVKSDAWPGREFSGRLATIEPRISEDSRNIRLRAELANPDQALRPGMYVTAALALPPLPNALVVPATAIQTSPQGDSVIAVRGSNARHQGKAAAVAVTVGRRLGNSVVVSKGLKPGDVVVTEGQLRIQPGADVRVSQMIPAVER